MRKDLVLDLADCTEFRQTLLARPPRIVHGTVFLLVLVLTAALLWSALTRADLVVRAAGRVRPVASPTRVFNAGRPEVLSASAGGRVVEVRCREGDTVRRGDVLIRLDTGRLDNEIARRQRTIQAGAAEIARLGRLEVLLGQQFIATRAKAKAELAQAEEEVRQAGARRAADIRLAEVELAGARDEAERLRRLGLRRAAAAADVVKTETRRREAQEKLEKVSLPIEVGRVAVARRALRVTEKDFAVKREELVLKREARQGEVEAARVELTGLKLERQQATLRAPEDGVVTRGDIKVGDLLEPGKPVVEIAAQQGFSFEAAVSTEDAAHLRVGMPARVKLDAYDYQKYGTLSGTVCFVSPDSEEAEGQRPARYIVRIALDGDEVGRGGGLGGKVRLGMAGQVEILTDQECILGLLLKRIRRTISLG
jgi:multidrug resistance efflux pump